MDQGRKKKKEQKKENAFPYDSKDFALNPPGLSIQVVVNQECVKQLRSLHGGADRLLTRTPS